MEISRNMFAAKNYYYSLLFNFASVDRVTPFASLTTTQLAA
ncbi:hypothetical protein RCH08_001243 [Janthinobacterium sp. CG_S6]|nr:hypothetical protein [Janthinobacterium sp. CG_S6]